MQLHLNIRLLLSFSFIMFVVEGDSGLNFKTGDYPILDVSTYIDAIFKKEHADAEEIFTRFLEKEVSPILYFEADFDKNVFERLARSKIREMIDESDKKNGLNYTRKLVISLRSYTRNEDAFQQIANLLNQHHNHNAIQTEQNENLVQVDVNAVVIDLQHLSPTSCDLFNIPAEDNSFILSTMRQLLRKVGLPQTQIGFGYNKNLSNNCSRNLNEKSETADFYVLTLDFETEVGLAESYGIFKNYLKSTLSKSKPFFEVNNIDPQPEVILRVNLKAHNGKYNEIFRSYQNLLRSFVTKWQLESGKNVILNVIDDVEISTFPHEENEESTTMATANIVPFLFRSVSPYEYSPSNCYKFGRRLNHVATKFDNLHLDFDAWLDIILQCRSQVKSENYCKMRYFPKDWMEIIRNQSSTQGHNVKECTIDNIKLNGPSNITLLVKLKSCYKNSCDSIHQVLDLLENNYEIYGMSVKSLIFLLDEKRVLNVSIGDEEENKRIPKHVSIGCKTDFGPLESDLQEVLVHQKSTTCPVRLPSRPEVSIWNFHLDLKKAFAESFSFEFYTRSIQTYLHKLYEMITVLRKLEGGHDVILRIIKTTPNEFNWKSDNNLFCNNAIVGSNLLLEAIANWADIHKIRVILKPAFDAGTVFGWWSSIENKEFVTRNNPYYSSFGRDPCVNWIDGSSGRIEFRANKNGGELITLDMGIREECYSKQQLNSTRASDESLSMDELKVLLTFGFHVFPKIELLPRANNLSALISDLDTITELLLEPNVSNYFQLNQIQNGSLVITLPIQFLSEAEGKVNNLLNASRSSSSIISVEALHIDGVRILCSNDTSRRITPAIFQGTSGFHCVNQVDLQRNLDLFQELLLKDTKIGLIYRCFNCPMTLAQISGVEEEWVKRASYIHLTYLDKVGAIRFPDKRGVQSYSDRQLKIKRAFLAQYPHLEKISFRPVMQTRVGKKEDYGVTITRYLSYISHDTRYGEAYDINSFVNGFQYKCMQVDGKQKLYKYGWWQISNHDDLTDTQVYSEMQSDYLKQETWRPQGENISETEITLPRTATSFIWVVFLISGFSILIISCLFGGVYRLRSRVQVLNGKEVREFYDGVDGEGFNLREEGNDESQDHSYRRQKFDENFEIAKSEFFQGERRILGMGNFGIVYKTLVKGISVAVKVPHENCSKETFRSLLIEVKILAFLGKHPNIVGFVGCYTKEISAGVIYIATELCEKDSLQNFLRKELGKRESADAMRIEELLRFSLEIASGMDYIGGKCVVHGDLSTRNVLLDGNLTCKIGDFGLSRKLYDYTKYVKTSQGPMPWRWMAYESLVKMEFTTKSDVWSYGVTLWEIFSLGAIPYPGLSWTVDFVDDLKKGFRMNSPEYATEETYLKIRNCWNFYPDTRPSFGELREFFLQLRNQLLYSEIIA